MTLCAFYLNGDGQIHLLNSNPITQKDYDEWSCTYCGRPLYRGETFIDDGEGRKFCHITCLEKYYDTVTVDLLDEWEDVLNELAQDGKK